MPFASSRTMKLGTRLGVLLLLAACSSDDTQEAAQESADTASGSTTGGPAQSTEGEASTNDSASTMSASTEGGEGSDETGSAADDDSGGSSGQPDGAPVFLNLSTNATQIEEEEFLLVSAIVTDPDGIRDLVGGQLTDDSGDIVLGTFATAAAEGAYEVSVPFDVLFELEIEEAGPTPVPRLVRATFFDQIGLSVSQTVSVDLACAGGFTCGGTDCGAGSATCHPVYAPDCPASQACTRVSAGGGPLNYRCAETGRAGVGEPCESGIPCSAGLDCAAFVCRQYCNDETPCGAGFTCEHFDAPPYSCADDGVCVPA